MCRFHRFRFFWRLAHWRALKELPREIQLPAVLHEAKAASGSGSLNLEEQEKQAILEALAQCHGNKKKAAAILGIHRPTLYSKMKHHGINLK